MKIKKNTFCTLVLEWFSPSTANCRKLKIQKIQTSTSPNGHAWCMPVEFPISSERKVQMRNDPAGCALRSADACSAQCIMQMLE
jgi:hypothetical protein